MIGIDFESARPNPADRASIFAPVDPYGKKDEYDSKKCGLDCVVYLHASNVNPLQQDKRLGAYISWDKPLIYLLRILSQQPISVTTATTTTTTTTATTTTYYYYDN